MLFRPAALILPHPMMMSCPESAQLVSHHRTVVWPLGHRWVHRFIHQEMMPDVVLKKPAAKVLCVLALRVLVLSVQESKRDQKQHVLTFCLRLWRSSEANLAVGMSHAEQIIAFVLSDMTTLTQEYSMLLECQVRSNPATHRGVCGVSIYIGLANQVLSQMLEFKRPRTFHSWIQSIPLTSMRRRINII